MCLPKNITKYNEMSYYRVRNVTHKGDHWLVQEETIGSPEGPSWEIVSFLNLRY